MKTAVRYYTKTGNTKRLAEAVAEAIGSEALPLSVPIAEPVDVLFLGNSYYAFSIDPEVREFIRILKTPDCLSVFDLICLFNLVFIFIRDAQQKAFPAGRLCFFERISDMNEYIAFVCDFISCMVS